MQTIDHIGENVLDLECKGNLDEFSYNEGLNVPDSLIAVSDSMSGLHYLIRTETPILKKGMKYDQESVKIIALADYARFEGLKLEVTKKSPGGGALNAAVGTKMLSNQYGASQQTRLFVPNGDLAIAQLLQDNYGISDYHPMGWNDEVGLNFNFTLDGEKITIRSPNDMPYKKTGKRSELLDNVGGYRVINTIKNKDYLESIANGFAGKRVLVATDSSITHLGIDTVRDLALQSDIIVSNDQELGTLIGIEINTDYDLDMAMHSISGRDGLVLTTLGPRGVAMHDGTDTYKQSTSIPANRVVNTNGCGDAAMAAFVVYLSQGLTPISAMIAANSAGQINATNLTASGKNMATVERLQAFQLTNGYAPVEHYKSGKFYIAGVRQ